MNTAEFLTISSSMVPERVALSDPDDSCTYAELQSRVNRLAHAFQGLGVGAGHNVGVMAVNSTAFVELYYATATVGATFVPLNYRSKTEELTYMINAAGVNVLFISERYAPRPGADTALAPGGGARLHARLQGRGAADVPGAPRAGRR